MKKKLNAFTIAELLVVLVVIGILAILMLAALGNKADKNKGLFKKAYSITERTVVELVNDETFYPYDFENFGFAETTDVKILGSGCYTSSTPGNCSDAPGQQNQVEKLLKFCNLFVNNINLSNEMKYEGSVCSFLTQDGIDWNIKETDSMPNGGKGFLITIDVNGSKSNSDNKNSKGPDSPEDVTGVATEGIGDSPDRDIFFIYVRDDGKMFLPEQDETAKQYLKSGNMDREEQKNQ